MIAATDGDGVPASQISTILKHDRKNNSYKIALVRAINDVALSFPDVGSDRDGIAIPLRFLAQFWISYYWPFCDPSSPILQGRRTAHAQDMAFRATLTSIRIEWQKIAGINGAASDGFLLSSELRVARRRGGLPGALLRAHDNAIKAIVSAVQMPIRYAGPGKEWTTFDQPRRLRDLDGQLARLPGAREDDLCVRLPAGLWETFREMSLWVEALCIHEWCLFTETVHQEDGRLSDRGLIYKLLTDRPDNRRPLTWERNCIDLLVMEGKTFICPWTEKVIVRATPYDVDHLIPLRVYPIDELWNLVPTDPKFNRHEKAVRLPSSKALERAEPHLALAYTNYDESKSLRTAMREDVASRFSSLPAASTFPQGLAQATTDFIELIATTRNVARFE